MTWCHRITSGCSTPSPLSAAMVSVVLPFPIWREAFINDADLETAQRAYDVLNPHPFKTFTDKISLKTNPADMSLAKSLYQLHGRYLAATSLPVAPAPVAETRAFFG